MLTCRKQVLIWMLLLYSQSTLYFVCTIHTLSTKLFDFHTLKSVQRCSEFAIGEFLIIKIPGTGSFRTTLSVIGPIVIFSNITTFMENIRHEIHNMVQTDIVHIICILLKLKHHLFMITFTKISKKRSTEITLLFW